MNSGVTTNQEESHDIFSADLVANALRDSGYRNAAYALAELIDNSIQAGATHVQVLIAEKLFQGANHAMRRIEQIAVLDDGTGMDSVTLRKSLKFGDGSRLQATSGMGRFGMGLPNASISQARRVDVWSWQAGIESALSTSIDLDNLGREVPAPFSSTLPSIWCSSGNPSGKSGTLVVWSNIDRCSWVQGKALLTNSEFVIGRMYRKFLESKRVEITFKVFPIEDPGTLSMSWQAKPNDPLYLMSPSSTPAPFASVPMFEKLGDEAWEVPFTISLNSHDYEVPLRFSIAKADARKVVGGVEAGNQPHGRHAKKNIGVSILREGRELYMETSLIDVNDPRVRWWGAEIDYPAALDSVMGTMNNKQDATILRSSLERYLELKKDPKELEQFLAESKLAHLAEGVLVELWKEVDRIVSGAMRGIKEQRVGGRRHTIDLTAEEQATRVAIERALEGFEGESDKSGELAPEVVINEIAQELIKQGNEPGEAHRIAAETVGAQLRFIWQESRIEGGAFFTVRSVAGEIIVTVNSGHLAHDLLFDLVNEETSGPEPLEMLQEKLGKAQRALKLLLMSWARMEDEAVNEVQRERIQEMRADWGKMAAKFLRKQD